MIPSQADQTPFGLSLTSAMRSAAVVVALSSASPPVFAARLEISVTGIRNDKGWLDICVFDADNGFPNCTGNRWVTRKREPPIPGVTRFDLDVVPGLHAVSVLHDENGNGQLDTGFLGIPREGVGVSNNTPPGMGPPRFADAAFQVSPKGDHITIRLVYP